MASLVDTHWRFFSGKRLVITGAGGQFGRAGAIYFATRGASVALFDIARDAVEETAAQVRALHVADGVNPLPRVSVHVVDVRHALAVVAAVEDAADALGGGIDLLWNNAGYQGAMTPTLEYAPKDFQQVMDVNVVGVFHVLQACAKQMAAQRAAWDDARGGGDEAGAGAGAGAGASVSSAAADDDTDRPPSLAIVNTASVAGLRGTPTMCAYVASKAAVIGLTMSAAKDLAPHGIRVNAVSPALIGPGFMWERQNRLHHESGSPYFAGCADGEALGRKKVASVPMKRLGSVNEVVKSVAFLLSDQSSYTTGTNLIVDGGLAMR